MSWGELSASSMRTTVKNNYNSVANVPAAGHEARPFNFGVIATTPPPTDPQVIMQRADEVSTIQRMLSDAQTSAVVLTGSPGAGKSLLAALLYSRLKLAKEADLPAPRYLVWLGIGTYTTLPDIIAAILNGVNMPEPAFFMLKPEQQVNVLLQALRRPQENALIVLDQFESLLHPETNQGVAGRGVLPLFLEMLQSDLGTSRFILTSYSSPYGEHLEETRVRSCLVSRISIPEGITLLQQRGLQGSPEELSLVWQRCGGHVFALVLFSALVQMSGISLSFFLNSPDYQRFWAGEVIMHLIASVYRYLNPIQYALMRALSLFCEPVSLSGIVMVITGSSTVGFDDYGRPFAAFEREASFLRKYGLVQERVNSAGVLCYSLHPLLRQYIHEHYLDGNEQQRGEGLSSLGLSNSSSMKAAQDSPEALQVALAAGHMQVAGYYLHVARRDYPPRDQRRGLQDVVPFISSIRHFCLGWRWQRACDLLFEEDLYESMVQWGAWNTLIGLYTALLPPFGVLLRRDEGIVCCHLGMLYGRLGEYQQSYNYFEQALALQQQIKDVRGEIATLANQGELLRIQGEHDKARIVLERALELNQQSHDPELQYTLLHNLGLLYHVERSYKQALSYYEEALHVAYTLKGQQNKGIILTNLGILLYEQGMQQEAIAILLAALQLRHALQDPGAVMLERFLTGVEHKMGAEAYAHLCQSALAMQQQVFARFVAPDMRQ